MRKLMTSAIVITAWLGLVPAWAQDSQGTTANSGEGTSFTTTHDTGQGELSTEAFSLKPEVGVVRYSATTDGGGNTRAAAGLDMEFNLARLTGTPTAVYTGIQTGVVYSHLGSAGGSFWGGSGGDQSTDPGANMLLIPADLKVGWNVLDYLRISAHGGGNLTYRSAGNSAAFGPSSGNTGAVWRIFPNVGGDIDVGITRNISLLLRPDVTLTTGSTLFTGTVGLGINLG